MDALKISAKVSPSVYKETDILEAGNDSPVPATQVIKKPPLTLIPKLKKPDPVPGVNLTLNPDFTLVRSDYRVRLARDENHLYTKATKLVSNKYGARGLLTFDAPLSERQPEEVTLAASSGSQVFGTLTLGMDSNAGLQADSLYRPEIDKLRTNGRRLCEVTRLALDSDLSCSEVMATIFNVAFVLAREVHERTDLLAEVHPRHAAFYRRTMGYQIIGPQRICQRVSAPAVLMHLCLEFARKQISEFAGTDQGRSLYRLFLPPTDQDTILQKLIVPASLED